MKAFGLAIQTQFTLLALTPLVLLDILLTPIVYGILVTSGIGQPDAATTLGAGFIGLWGTVVTQAGLAIAFDKQWRTLDLQIIAPTPISVPITGRIMTAVLQGLVAIPITWLTISLIWEFPTTASFQLVAAAALIGSLGFLGLGLLLAALLVRYRYFAGMVNGLQDTVALLAGFFVPIAVLPVAVQIPGFLFGPRWALEAVRHTQTVGSASLSLLVGFFVSLFTISIAFLYLSRLETKVRHNPEALMQ